MPEYSRPEFGEAVRRVLQEHGLTLRAQRIRTGIDHTTMKSMCDGIPGRLEKVEQFARAFDLDVNEWRGLAGFPPVEPANPLSAAEQLLEAVDHEELTYETEWEGITADAYLGAEEMSENDRRRVMAAMRRVLEADKRRRERGKG